jgi:hypothetical protein
VAIVGARLVTDALYDFITTSSGVKKSLNNVIEVYRSARSYTTEMPDVATFGQYVYLGSQVQTKTPYLAVVWDGSDEETANNSREIPHRLSLYLLLVEGDVTGDEETLVQRALDYDACIRSMFLRSTSPGAFGYTLNNGGTAAPGRILRAEITGSEMLDDMDLNTANIVLRWTLRVVAIEDYPGA